VHFTEPIVILKRRMSSLRYQTLENAQVASMAPMINLI